MSISHLVHTLRAYAPVIMLSTAGLALLYAAIAVAVYLFSPAQRVTSQNFRLDFNGASEGRYPNGIKFSSNDITSGPVLLKVFKDNQLERFTTFDDFSRAEFVLESNPDYEKLAADYQARLADLKQSAIDRERVLREWQSKSASIAKNYYSLIWLRTSRTAAVPETLVRKALLDTLATWARYAQNEQHVLKYRITVFSPQMIGPSYAGGEPVVAVQVLRSKIEKVLENINALLEVPGAELIRSSDGASLEEIRLRLEELIRFRLEPLTGQTSVADRAATLRFLESQLAYDQRALKAAQDYAESIRQSFAVYSLEQHALTPQTAGAAAAPSGEQGSRTQQQQAHSDTVMPQFTDTFLDRLITLTSQVNDMEYRQKLVNDYRRASQLVIPAQQSVTYDQNVLAFVQNAAAAGSGRQAADSGAELVAMQNEVRQLLGRIYEIYESISSNQNPSKELYALTAPPVLRNERSRSLTQLALYGVALLALALPLIVILCLVHARVREEEAGERYVPATDVAAR